MHPYTVTGFVAPERPEDAGTMMVCDNMGGVDTPLVVRLSSFDPSGEHAILEDLRGKRVRVTVEIIE